MTKIEYGKCEKLMEEAIRKAKQANEEYKELNIIHADDIRSKLTRCATCIIKAV